MNAINLFLRAGLVVALLLFLQSCGQPQASSCTPYALEGPLDTIKFEQAPFEWHITPRHDYSQTYVTKLFLSQAEFDRDLLGLYKMRDNGKQTVYMTFEQALDAVKGMDAITLDLFADGISTMWKDDYLHVSKNGNVLADRGDVFIPALWLGSGSVVAYSEDGYSERSWTLPEGVSLPRNAAAWTVTPGGLTEFTGLKVRGRTVTLSLAPDQMVVIGNLK